MEKRTSTSRIFGKLFKSWRNGLSTLEDDQSESFKNKIDSAPEINPDVFNAHDDFQLHESAPEPIQKKSSYQFRNKCVSAEYPEKLGNTKNLPVVQTVFNTYELNKAIEEGFKTIVVKRKSNPQLKLESMIFRNINSGEYAQATGRSMIVQYGTELEYPEDEWELIHKQTGYARPSSLITNWGAYVLPKDIKVGDRVYIEELIEDIVASAFWHSVSPADDAEAIWNGKYLEIDHAPYDRFHRIG